MDDAGLVSVTVAVGFAVTVFVTVLVAMGVVVFLGIVGLEVAGLGCPDPPLVSSKGLGMLGIITPSPS